MKTLPTGLGDHLARPATTLARLWRLTRNDGAVFGFTDHDRDLVVAGVTYAAASGLDASEAAAATGLGVGGLEVAGALSALQITEADILAGLWDGAAIETYLADWTDPSQPLALGRAVLGEVTRRDNAFVAEIRGPAVGYDAPVGRLYQHRCDADLGDGRCGVALDGPDHRGTGSVVAVSGRRRLTVAGLDGFAAGWFDGGRLDFASGANAGRGTMVGVHAWELGAVVLDLWQPMAATVAAGDAFVVTAGCDKRFETCRDRFGNALNFRGFPHIPGSDFVIANAASATSAGGEPMVP